MNKIKFPKSIQPHVKTYTSSMVPVNEQSARSDMNKSDKDLIEEIISKFNRRYNTLCATKPAPGNGELGTKGDIGPKGDTGSKGFY